MTSTNVSQYSCQTRYKRLRSSLLVATALQLVSVATAVAQEGGIEEVVVTSNRRAEVLSKVPISVAAYTNESMAQNGVKQLSDLVRLTPGLVVSNSSQNSGNSISIRGIASTAGSATTGIYIDDTPIQAAALGTGGYGQIYPAVFDLDRVEVLRGPQGTLFGAGSEGGTVRFIQAQPSLSDFTIKARAEVNSVGKDGSTGYEYGLAGGGPILNSVLGFRVSAYYKKQGGWIDETQGTFNVLTANGSNGPGSVQFQPGGIVDNNANWSTTTALRAALTWAPFDNVDVTASVQYEDHFIHYQGGTFSVQASDRNSDTYVNLMAVPTIDALHVATPDPLNEPSDDQFVLPTLHANWNLDDKWSLVSHTSLLVRKQYGWGEYPSYETTYAKRCCVLAGDKADGIRSSNYNNVSEELRLQFSDPSSWISGTAGVFYANFRQEANQYSLSNYFHNLSSTGTSAVVSGVTYPGGVTNGAPFGPGYNAWTNYFGLDLPTFNAATSPTRVPGAAAGDYPYTVSYYSHLVTHQEQGALFAQVDIKPTDDFTIIVGVRGGLISSDIGTNYGGATSNLNAPHGLPCVPGTGGPGQSACSPVATGKYAPGTGPFTVAFPGGNATSFERSFTPKLGLQYQIDDDNMVYSTASKGFRPGGSQTQLNSGCDFQLISLGYSKPNPSGSGLVADSPTQYKSDSVWNYEIGSKNRLMGGKLSVDTSAYLVTWRDIQSPVSINSCNQSIVDNLGGAVAKGMDMSVIYQPIPTLTLGLVGGYNETSFTGNTILGGNKVYSAGSAIPASGPPIRVNLSARYDFMLDNLPLYFVGDVGYQSKTRRSGTSAFGAYNFDGNLRVDEAYTQTNVRIGLQFDKIDLSAFVTNLTDEAPLLGYTHTSSTNPVYTAYTLQPRTAGLTLSYKY